MTEIEIKARVKDHTKCEEAIIRLGGAYLRRDHQLDLIFSRPEDLDENKMMINGTFIGRIRQENDRINLEFKEVNRGGGMREISAPIYKISDGEYLFKSLGFKKAFSTEKYRKRFLLKDFEISLDEVTRLGSFIEIEHASKDGLEVEKILSECKTLLKEIDSEAVLEPKKYGDLMQEMINNKRGL